MLMSAKTSWIPYTFRVVLPCCRVSSASPCVIAQFLDYQAVIVAESLNRPKMIMVQITQCVSVDTRCFKDRYGFPSCKDITSFSNLQTFFCFFIIFSYIIDVIGEHKTAITYYDAWLVYTIAYGHILFSRLNIGDLVERRIMDTVPRHCIVIVAKKRF